MSHKFRFAKDCMERLKSYCGRSNTEADPHEETAQDTAPVKEPEAAKKPATEAARAAEKPSEDGLLVVTRTDIGKVRSSNQDAVIEAEGLYGVADGMGGHRGGETASAGARDGLVACLAGKTPSESALREAFLAVNRRLFTRQQEDEALSGMGTTLTVLWLDQGSVLIGHVGDSRAYLLRDGALTQVTEDHSVVAEMVREGMITRKQAETHPMRNVITRAVGTEAGVMTDVSRQPRQKGDRWLVCSDGLYGMVPEEKIAQLLKEKPPEEAADALLTAALAAGGRDNVSLVILQDGEGAR